MFFLGVAALIQVVFLPGFLLLKLCEHTFSYSPLALSDLHRKSYRRVIFSFAFSLIINYLLVLTLTTFSFYTRPVMLSIFGLELLIFFLIQSKTIYLFLNQNLFDVLKQSFDFSFFYNLVGKKSWIINFVILIGSLISIYWIATFFVGNLTSFSIFKWHDAIVSWNRWAEDWFFNKYPVGVLNYPQLIPTNWSIFYKFIGQPIQYFPKIIMPLFSLSILLLMFDLGIRKKSIGYFAAIIATTLFFKNAFGAAMLNSGLVDIPVAFMAFISIYCLLVAHPSIHSPTLKASENTQDERGVEVPQYLFLGIIFAAGAAVTKQPGLYLFAIYPLLAYFLVFKQQKTFCTKKNYLNFIGLYLLAFCVLVVPFYFYAIMYSGSSTNSVLLQASLHGGTSLLSKLIFSTKIFLSYNLFYLNIIHNYYLHFTLGIIVGLFYVALLLFSLINRSSRYLLLFFLAPWLLVWSYTACYDFRNLAIAVPIYGLCLGLGFEELLSFKSSFIARFFKILKSIKIYILLLLVLLVLVLINFRYSENSLIFEQRELMLKKDNEKLNRLLLKYKHLITSGNLLLTGYPFNRIEPLRKIPHIYARFFMGKEEVEKGINLKNERLNNYFKIVKNPEIKYLLIPDNAFSEIKNDIENKIKEGECLLIFHEEGHMFLEKVG